MKFRNLRADEVECRIGTVGKNGNGLSLLLYKNARCDANVLDETVGAENWQCEFYDCKGTLFCKVGILIERPDGLYEWVWKDDAGSPSNMEAAKGEASDAFKRACFKWGLGRELYTGPFIWIKKQYCNLQQYNGRWTCYDHFRVSGLEVTDGRITYLQIINEDASCVAYEWRA